MREFFQGWRRNVGCFTLVMASATCGLWVRGQRVTDELIVPGRLLPAFRSRWIVYSSIRGIELERQWSDNQGADYTLPNGQFISRSIISEDRRTRLPESSFDPVIDKQNCCCDFIFETGHLKHGGKVRTWVAPFWSFILPLTLLSAYLILWKPRKAK
jgi:hypothetical protein